MAKIVRVGNASGYWGDDLDALHRQLTQGPLDYVTLDFLAEITMSILQKQRARKPELGYAMDFVDQMRRCLPILHKTGTRVISNAGGINPYGGALEIDKISRAAGLQTKIAVIAGDDLMDRIDQLLQKGITLKNMETGEELAAIRERVESANAYLGAAPVIKALETDAQVIITGRVTDTGITAAAPAFEFRWSLEDWDRLASAVVAGHILECGAQASGGNLTDWREVPSFQDMAYPIAEFSADGSFVVTKHKQAGGCVTRKTVTEQLVYEMGDPRSYITPDVIADFSTIILTDEGNDRVRVSGVQGRPRTDQLKVSISYRAGYKAHGSLIISRPEAVDKCHRLADMFWKRLGLEFEETGTELVGYNATHRHLIEPFDPPEILLRLGVRDPDQDKVEEFAKKFTSLILSGTPGVAIVGARPRVQDVVAYWPCLIPAREVTPEVTLFDTGKKFQIPWQPPPSEPRASASGFAVNERNPLPDGPPSLKLRRALRRTEPAEALAEAGRGSDFSRLKKVRLIELCYGRSGDKGDTCNIGVVARSEKIYDWLRRELAAARVQEYFGEICKGEVERFEVPNLLALNFLLHESLGGGGTVSLRIDPQGKTMAAALLMMEVEISEELIRENP